MDSRSSSCPAVFDISEDEEEENTFSKAKTILAQSSSPTINSNNNKNNNSKNKRKVVASSDEDESSGSEKPSPYKKVKQDNRPTIHKSMDNFRKKKEAGHSASKVGHISVISDSDDDEKTPTNNSAIVISSDEEEDDIDASVQHILNYRGQSSSSSNNQVSRQSTSSKSKPSKPSPSSSKQDSEKKHKVQTFLEFKKKKSSLQDTDSDSENDDGVVTPEKVSRILRKTREKKNTERDLEDFIVNGEEQSGEEDEEENGGEEEYEDGSEEETEEEEEYLPNSQGDDDFDILDFDSEEEDVGADLKSIFTSSENISKQEKAFKERMKKRTKKSDLKLEDVGNGWKKDADNDYYLEGGLVLDRDVYTKLYSFQKEGIKWLNSRYNADKYRGGILADEMGLGKTVQVSAFLGGLAGYGTRRYLIIAPLSVLQTWASELDKWAPNIKTFVFHGLSSKEQYNSMARDFNACAKRDKSAAIITTFRTLVTYTVTLASLCAKQEFDVTIVDEAHQIKNDQTGISKNLRKIGAKAKFCLTGTPIMNKLMEMWSIYDYIFYGDNILGDKKEFKTNFERLIVKSRKRDASNTEKVLGNKLSQRMRSLIQPYILRRHKNQVLESDHNVGLGTILKKQSSGKAKISQKNELVLWCYLSKPQDNVYTQYLQSEVVRQILGKKSNRSCIFSALSTLKMLCNHPRLNNGSAQILGRDLNEDEAFDKFVSEGDEKDYLDTSGMTCKELIEESSKLQLIVKLLKEHKKTGHRTLIFSQYKTMLDIVERIIKEYLKLKTLRIDGGVAAKERQSRVDLFQKNNTYSCFLLTTGSGGVGLTLTAADRVILIDPHWNPAVDQQAVDRAYRVGQTKNVVTYRLITVGTLEEVVYRRQVIKDGLIKNTLTKENQYRYFTSDQELLEVFTLRDKQSSETKKLLAELHPKGEIYEELGNHVKQLEDYSEIHGITWHDMLYNIESDDINESFNYEDDAFVQQNHTITNYVKRKEQKLQRQQQQHQQQYQQVVDLSSPARNLGNGHPSSSAQQIVIPPHMLGVPDAYLIKQPQQQQHVFHHYIPPQPQQHQTVPYPHPQHQPGFLFQPNQSFVQQHETVSPNGHYYSPQQQPQFYHRQPFPPQQQAQHRNNGASSSMDIPQKNRRPRYQPPPSNTQEDPEIIDDDDDDEVLEQPPPLISNQPVKHEIINNNVVTEDDEQADVPTDGESENQNEEPIAPSEPQSDSQIVEEREERGIEMTEEEW